MNGKHYVGKHNGKLGYKYAGSGPSFRENLKERPDDFERIYIRHFDNVKQAEAFEAVAIDVVLTRTPHLSYNVQHDKFNKHYRWLTSIEQKYQHIRSTLKPNQQIAFDLLDKATVLTIIREDHGFNFVHGAIVKLTTKHKPIKRKPYKWKPIRFMIVN